MILKYKINLITHIRLDGLKEGQLESESPVA